MAHSIRVEVVFALPDRQRVIALDVDAGTTLYDAVRQSGIAAEFPGLVDLERSPVGVFGKLEKNARSRVLDDGDRVEIYRPLLFSPNARRKARAGRRRGTDKDGKTQ